MTNTPKFRHFLTGDISGLTGNLTGLTGDATGLAFCVDRVAGSYDRAAGTDIRVLEARLRANDAEAQALAAEHMEGLLEAYGPKFGGREKFETDVRYMLERLPFACVQLFLGYLRNRDFELAKQARACA
jgi:hypothetical protein